VSPPQAAPDLDNLLDARTLVPPAPRVAATPRPARQRRPILMWLVLGAALVAGGVYGVGRYLDARHYETTDNAFIEGRAVAVSPRVSGHVLRVHISDNQHVAAGDLLVELDPNDFESRAVEARGALSAAQAKVSAAQAALATIHTTAPAIVEQGRSGVASAEAALQAVEAEARRAASDLARYEALFKAGGITASQLDTYRSVATATEANRMAAEKRVAEAQAALAAVDVAAERIAQAEAEVARAQGEVTEKQARVRQAELDVSYTRLYAPEAGTVTKKAVEPGVYVRTGQGLFALVADEKWVVANFKETQLKDMRVGQMVEARIDAYPTLRLEARVESIQRGTGARFSLLPAENATGNYVKVVQRVPVKLVFTAPPPADLPLSLGMSVEPKVRVR